MQLATTKNFNGIQLDCYRNENDNNDFWATREQIGQLLGYENPRKAISNIHLRNQERLSKFTGVLKLRTPLGGIQSTTVYSFKGLLEICRYSNQPLANAVIDFLWDVADDIRKYGMYMSDKVMNEMIEDSDKYKALMGMYVAERTKTKAFEENIKQIMPYAAIGKTVLSRPGSITVGECACFLQQHGLLAYGRNGLYKELRDKKLLCSTKGRWNKPTEKGIRLGIVNLELDTDGNFVFSTKAMVTPEGLMKLAEEKFDAEYPLLALLKNTEKELQKAVGVNE